MARPKPLPTNVRVLRGETRPSQIGHGDPQPPALEVVPPDWISVEVRAEWDRLMLFLVPMGLVTVADIDDLVVLCSAIVQHRVATQQVDADGITITAGNGGTVRNPATLIQHQAAQRILQYGGRFGMSPSDRAGMGRAGFTPSAPGSSASDLLDG